MSDATIISDPAPVIAADRAIATEPVTNPEADLALLRQYEPIVHYTKGELFFPAKVDEYVAQSSMWVHRPSTGRNERLVPAGNLSVDNLSEPRTTEFGAVEFLRRVEDVDLATQARALLAGSAQDLPEDQRFHPGAGRLARVGYVSRLIDAVFTLSLLVRGHTPGAVVAASARAYRAALAADEQYVYYGRVVRGGGWVALQYRFFYYFNDYRSTFDGVDDHEADWEMALVYLSNNPDSELKPEWVAYACHDFSGDDLRRRWDDDEGLIRVGDHPVIFAGGGSHASYFKPGEYLLQIELPITKSLRLVGATLSRFWSGTLRQGSSGRARLSVFTVPFVDYARGDGLSIGPGQAKAWAPVNLDPIPDWVTKYRGLWGLFTGDQLGGEDAPAGPMFNRDGTVRQAWYDPFGFAGLDKVAPPTEVLSLLERQRTELVEANDALGLEIRAKTDELRLQNEELVALAGNPYVEREYDTLFVRVKDLVALLRTLHRANAENTASLESIDLRIRRLREGRTDDPKAHIRHANEPTIPRHARFDRAAEIWAGISIGLVLIALVTVVLVAPAEFLPTAAFLIGLTLFIDALFRGVAEQFVNALAVVLAIASAAILLWTFWELILLGLLLVAGVYLTWQNLRAVAD